jgi:1-aminocyclopropane-1-carboxylate deaminase
MLSKFERYKLTFGPTPIEKLFRLTAQIFASGRTATSGLAYGGNKLRKLGYIVPDVTWLAPCGKGGPPTS